MSPALRPDIRHRRPSRGWPFLLALGLLACSDSPVEPEPEPEPEPEFRSATLSPATANVNSARVDVDASGYDSVAFVLRTAGEVPERSASYAFEADSASGSALGMLAGRDYEIDVWAFAGTDSALVDTLRHTTGPLPAWIPSIGAAGDPANDGFIGLAHPDGPVIVDNQGRVRWYFASADPVLLNFQAHPSGEYTLFGRDDAERLYRVLNERGEQIRTVGCVGLETRFHEVRIEAGGDAWVLCDDEKPADLSPWGGAADGSIVWNTLQKVTPAGTVSFEFRTEDFYSPNDADSAALAGATELNLMHGNGIAFHESGDIVLSWRSLNEITRVSIADTSIVWRLGGRGSDFVIDDPTREFERQHGVRWVGPGVVQFLDNGTEAPSRLMRYDLDETTMTASVALEYVDASMAFTLVGGGTEVLEGNRALVSFGRAGRVVEVDATGSLTFELTGLESIYIFRAFRIPSLYASLRSLAD